MIRLAVVEDDDRQAARLQDYAARYAGQKQEEIGTVRFGNGLSFLEAYDGSFDAVFLDIAMPVMDGMECAVKLRQKDEEVPIIFITSMAQYAIRGYEVWAMAFMVKPVRYEEFSMKMDRLLKHVKSRTAVLYAVAGKDGTRVVPVSSITFIEVFDHDLVFHTAEGDLTAPGSLRALTEDERFAAFLKVSPAHLVNASHVTGIGKDTISVRGTAVPLSRRRRKECLEKLAHQIGGRMA